MILAEGVRRLIEPAGVDGGAVLAVALAGIVVNLAATWVLAGAERRSLNVEGAFQHVLTDLFAFIATAIAGVVILATGFGARGRHRRAAGRGADAALGLGPAARLRPRAARGRAARPRPRRDRPRARAAEPHVVEVHDLHVWEVTSGMPSLSAHVTVGAGCDTQAHRRQLADLLSERFGIEHTTLQVEARHEGPLEIEPLQPGQRRA